MGFFDKLEKSKGGFIFLSHSHHDIEKVRRIRNRLEEEGFDPLCFYLKCLDEDGEIEDLIKREIDAREWFVFADSPNSRKSKWVTLEREYIKSRNSKKILTVNLEDERAVGEMLEKLVHNLRVFISASAKDFDLACRIKKKMEEKDYMVFFGPDSLSAGSSFLDTMENAILEASREGAVLALLTPETVKSTYVEKELIFAIQNKGNVIGILVGEPELSGVMQDCLSICQCFYLPEQPDDAQLEQLVERISEAILAKKMF